MQFFAKIGLSAVALSGLLTLSSAMAEAKGFSPGHYRLLGENGADQNVCVRSNGTWSGTNFNWGGRWVNRNLNGTLTGFMWGNVDGDSFNNSIIALGVANSKWTEWTDNGASLSAALNAVRITKIGSACPVFAPRENVAGDSATRRKK